MRTPGGTVGRSAQLRRALWGTLFSAQGQSERDFNIHFAGFGRLSLSGDYPMRLAYLSAPILGLLLVGCGADEEPEREPMPPQPTTEQPTPPQPTTTPPSDTDAGTGMGTSPGTTGTGVGAGPETGAGTGMTTGPSGDMSTAPADNGSGLGTESGAGTAPNTTGTGTGAAQ
jgi:hypothetical protein